MKNTIKMTSGGNKSQKNIQVFIDSFKRAIWFTLLWLKNKQNKTWETIKNSRDSSNLWSHTPGRWQPRCAWSPGFLHRESRRCVPLQAGTSPADTAGRGRSRRESTDRVNTDLNTQHLDNSQCEHVGAPVGYFKSGCFYIVFVCLKLLQMLRGWCHDLSPSMPPIALCNLRINITNWIRVFCLRLFSLTEEMESRI